MSKRPLVNFTGQFQFSRFTTGSKTFQQLYTETIKSNRRNDKLNYWKVFGLGLMPVTCIYLTWWQVHRLQWKQDLLRCIQSKQDLQPILLDTLDLKNLAVLENEFRIVLLKGTLDFDNELVLGPRTFENQVGYFLFSPFQLDNGQRVLVKRGWIAKDKLNRNLRPLSKVEGEVIVKGQLRSGEKGNRFTPPNNPDSNLWYYTNVEEMAKQLNCLPILVELVNDESSSLNSQKIKEGRPIPRNLHLDIPNNHLQYAITWFTLACFTGVMFFSSIRKTNRLNLPNPKDTVLKSNKFL